MCAVPALGSGAYRMFQSTFICVADRGICAYRNKLWICTSDKFCVCSYIFRKKTLRGQFQSDQHESDPRIVSGAFVRRRRLHENISFYYRFRCLRCDPDFDYKRSPEKNRLSLFRANDDIIISEEYNYQNLKSQYQDITIMLTERMKVILR